jgi:penicillin-insensitive murein endopeptidase
VLLLAALLAFPPLAAAREPSFCADTPEGSVPMSFGTPSNGRVEGAVRFVDTASARILPLRHRARCLSWGTPRLVRAIAAAGAAVARTHPGSPPLGVGNIGRARGGAIPYSHSHQAGRDADLAFYLLDRAGKPIAATDLVTIGDSLHGLDAARTWTLVQALVEDPSIQIRWIFVSTSIKGALLREGEQAGASRRTLRKADHVLHQPTDAPPHDDHLHLRIRCTLAESRGGCRDG